jgi:hypothetical protein
MALRKALIHDLKGASAEITSSDVLLAAGLQANGNIYLNGQTAASPMLKAVGTTVKLRLGDDTADAPLTAGASIFSGNITFANDNVSDVGQSGANRPRSIYTSSDVFVGGAVFVGGTSRSRISTAVDGNLLLANNAVTSFGLLQFGGVSATSPAWKRNGIHLEARLADDSAYTDMRASAYQFGSGTWIQESADGVLKLLNTAQSSFNRLQFGGATSSYVALSLAGTTLKVRLADDSADAAFAASSGTFSGNITGTSIQASLDVQVSTGAAISRVILNASAGQDRRIDVRTAGSARWTFGADSTAEGGANAGTNFAIRNFDDTGTQIITPFAITRADGQLTLISNNQQSLNLKGGTANNVYIGFYADSAAQGTRTGYLGYGGSPGDRTFTIGNTGANADIQVAMNGTGAFTVQSGAGISLQSTMTLKWLTCGQIKSPADGQFTLLSNNGLSFTILNLGPASASFPGLKRVGTSVAFRLGDDTADTAISFSGATASGTITHNAGTPVVVSSATIISRTATRHIISGTDPGSLVGGEGWGKLIQPISSRGGVWLGARADSSNKDDVIFSVWTGSDGSSYTERFMIGQNRALINSPINIGGLTAIGVKTGPNPAGNQALEVLGGNLKFSFLGAPSAVSAALAGAGSGNLSNGVYLYRVTYITQPGTGESVVSGSVSVTVVDNTINGQVSLTNIPVSTNPFVLKRKIYRTTVGTTNYFLLTTINDNTTTTFTDNVADGSLGAAMPTQATDSGSINVDGVTAIQFKAGGLLIGISGIGSAFPALKRSGTTLQVRLGDDSADAPISAAGGTFSGGITASTGGFSGVLTVTGPRLVVAANTAATQNEYIQLTPTDGGVSGKPHLFIRKESTANTWRIMVYDGTAANGVIEIGATNVNITGGQLTFAGLTSAFPMLKRSGTTLQVRLADDSGSGDFNANRYFFATGTIMSCPADGDLLLRDSASSTFGLLKLGGTTASFPAFKRSGATIQTRLADDSAFCDLSSGNVIVNGYFASGGPGTQGGTTYTVAANDNDLIFTSATGCVVTLPAPASFTGRVLYVKTTGGGAVTSASSNVVPLAGGAAGTAILASTAGKWARLKSDGANWITMAAA